MNNDGTLDILDLVGLANLILSNEYLSSGDMNQDGQLNILTNDGRKIKIHSDEIIHQDLGLT